MKRDVCDVLIERDDLAIRRMRDDKADYALMAKWLTDERVLEFYEGRDNPFPIERIKEKYAPRVLAQEGVVPCFLLHRAVPVGYIQYYPVVDAADYDLGKADGVYGVDLFIGEPELWGRGLGTRAVPLLLDYVFDHLHAAQVVLDPHMDNLRAIRCYEKCGFRKIKVLRAHELHEGKVCDCWLMSVER